jgi:MFS family permease
LPLLLLSGAIGIAGITLWHFWTGLALLGVGWNFAFIGATTMVTECYRPNERNKVQAFNDFLIFGSMAIGSFSSGMLLVSFGWTAVNEVMFPVVLAAGALLIWGARLRHPSLRDRLSVAQLERHDHQHEREVMPLDQINGSSASAKP